MRGEILWPAKRLGRPPLRWVSQRIVSLIFQQNISEGNGLG
jgi:hypothetical protein